MKIFLHKVVLLLFIVLGNTIMSSAQGDTAKPLRFEINQVYLPLSISKTVLTNAQSLIDLNQHYHADWVKEYISVEISTQHQGKTRRSVGNDDKLTEEQMQHLYSADVATDITVNVSYIPENNLKQNEPREMSFSFMVNPEHEAHYLGGKEQLQTYLKENALDKISTKSFDEMALAAINFTVTEKGEIINPRLAESSKDEKIDELLLNTVSNMPDWKPAAYGNGKTVRQQFVLMVGNMESCTVNFLNVRRE